MIENMWRLEFLAKDSQDKKKSLGFEIGKRDLIPYYIYPMYYKHKKKHSKSDQD